MGEEQEKQFKNDCATLLELAQEIVLKYGLSLGMGVHFDSNGAIFGDRGRIAEIGYKEPKNKAVICK